jgi:hypothetical protein
MANNDNDALNNKNIDNKNNRKLPNYGLFM